MLSDGGQRIIEAHLHTLQALITAIPADQPALGLGQRNGPGGAHRCTLAAGDTLDVTHHQLGRGGLGFRVGTPGAFQGAAFHKHGCPDPRPIMDTEALDVENNAPVVLGISHMIKNAAGFWQ